MSDPASARTASSLGAAVHRPLRCPAVRIVLIAALGAALALLPVLLRGVDGEAVARGMDAQGVAPAGEQAATAPQAGAAGADPASHAPAQVQGRTARLCLMALGTHKDYRPPHGREVDLVIVTPELKAERVLRRARAAHPETKIFAYLNTMDIMLSRVEEGPSFWKEHEEWFLHDEAGERVRVRIRGYKGARARYAMNVAHPGYQDYLGGKAVALMKAGYDGIQLDNVETGYSYKPRYVGRFFSAPLLPEEMTESKWYAGEVVMLRRIRAMADEAGFRDREIIFNHIRAGEPDRSMEYLAEVDGANAENWLDRNVAPGGAWGWRSRVDLVQRAAKAGKRTNLLCESSHPSRDEALFTFASYLMAMAGDRSTFWYGKPYRVGDMPWYDFYDADLGRPAGEMRSIGGGLYRREFERGIVLVNPEDSPARAALLGPFWNDLYERVETFPMAARSGALLLRPGPEEPERWTLEAESCLEPATGGEAPPAGLLRVTGRGFRAGAAVEFTGTQDLCILPVELPAGRYRVAVEGEGKGPRADAALVRVGKDFRRVALHPSRRQVFTAEIASAVDSVALKGGEPGVTVDRLVLVRIGEAR